MVKSVAIARLTGSWAQDFNSVTKIGSRQLDLCENPSFLEISPITNTDPKPKNYPARFKVNVVV